MTNDKEKEILEIIESDLHPNTALIKIKQLLQPRPEKRPEIIVLCGSTRFEKEYIKLNEKYTLQGKIVLSCGVFKNPNVTELQKYELDELHKRKIDIADTVFIIDKDNYIGQSTKSEIEYAKKLNKNILYYSIVKPESEQHRFVTETEPCPYCTRNKLELLKEKTKERIAYIKIAIQDIETEIDNSENIEERIESSIELKIVIARMQEDERLLKQINKLEEGE